MTNTITTLSAPATLIDALRELIQVGRQRALRAVDMVQVQTCWEIGRHIVEFEQAGEARALYGKQLLVILSKALTEEFGKGFDESNLRYMRGFFRAFPIRDTVCHELSWSHYRTLVRVESEAARLWYLAEAVKQNWSVRALDRQISTLYYDRLVLSADKQAVRAEALKKTSAGAMAALPRSLIHDPVMLEFLGLPETGKLLESNLEAALMDKLQSFLLELGRGFSFIGRQQRISTESQDFYIDLVFYHYVLKCFILFELKTTKLTHQDIGQMDMYVRMFDDLKRDATDNPTLGIILCSHKDEAVVRYSVLHGSEQLFASKYKLALPTEEELRTELLRERQAIEDFYSNQKLTFKEE
ncbi:MAG: PDDEXK nuclease domain-containing protein [Cytophagales bacterium]|nr:PDDEXK nuclease domain-containing protein [Cytophagales bacterium]